MTVTAASFRAHFPEFASTVQYPDSQVNFWLANAVMMLIPDRWGTMLDTGVEMYTAHYLVLERQAQVASSSGGIPGLGVGVVSNKAVGPVSVGYDTQAGLSKDAGHWNLTTYGLRFYSWMRMFGAGGALV